MGIEETNISDLKTSHQCVFDLQEGLRDIVKIARQAQLKSQRKNEISVNVIYVPCHWFSCFCPFSKVTVNVLDVIVVRKLSPSKLLCLPPHLKDCHL